MTDREFLEPVAWFRAPYGTLEPNPLFRVTGPQSLDWAIACFTEDQLRAAVAAERERWAIEIAELRADRDSWAQQASDRTQDAVDLVAAERERHADALRCALDALDHCCDDTTGRHRAVAQRLREMLNG